MVAREAGRGEDGGGGLSERVVLFRPPRYSVIVTQTLLVAV